MSKVQNDLEQIVKGYRNGYSDKLRALSLVQDYRSTLSPEEIVELRVVLTNLFLTSDMTTRQEGGYSVNVTTFAFSCLAEFSSIPQLIEIMLQRFPAGVPEKIVLWTDELFPELRWNLMRFQDRIDDEALERIRKLAAAVRNNWSFYPPTVLAAVEQLQKSAEFVEYQRFATNLTAKAVATAHLARGKATEPLKTRLNQVVENALRKAGQHLQDDGEFDAKTAADLIRTAMDEAHRDFVKALEISTGHPYGGEDKDGFRRAYMRKVDFINESEEKFFSEIYTLISREASHRLIAPRETVLLLHQTVYGYLMLLADRLQKFQTPKAAQAATVSAP